MDTGVKPKLGGKNNPKLIPFFKIRHFFTKTRLTTTFHSGTIPIQSIEGGSMPKPKPNGVYGRGTNDATYAISRVNPDGTKWVCPVYLLWKKLVKDDVLCPEWLYFSKFHAYVEANKKEGHQLILVDLDQPYSQENCVYAPNHIAEYVKPRARREVDKKDNLPEGVFRSQSGMKFVARFVEPIYGDTEHVGTFDTPKIARANWESRRRFYALKFAMPYIDKDDEDSIKIRTILTERFRNKGYYG
jgi:hypothetical protein